MAVGIRDAPGEPTAMTPPSSDEKIVGLMLEISRSPGSSEWKPLGFSSGSPRVLFTGMPVPGITSPDP
jgi:hypothetical protein